MEEKVKNLGTPRIFTTHLRPRFLPECIKTKDIKVIHVFRNPKDIYLSWFKLTTNLVLEEISFQGSWEEFFELQLAGEYGYGSWFDYVQEWNTFIQDNPDKVFLAQFERMRENPKEVFKCLCRFLDKSEELANMVADASCFDAMKIGTEEKKKYENETVQNGSLSMVTGKISSWKRKFTVEQSERFNQFFKDYFKGSSVFVDGVQPYL